MRGRLRIRHLAIGSVLAVALLGSGCTNPTPPGGLALRIDAVKLRSLDQQEFGGPNFWDNDAFDEPYLVHLATRIKLNQDNDVLFVATSTYSNNGQFICKIAQGEECDGIPGDGAYFGGVALPDFVELNAGEKLELIGSVEVMYERDVLLPIGIVEMWQGIAGLVTDALRTIIQNNGALPSEPTALLAFLEQIIPDLLTTLLGIVAQNLGALVGGDGDDLIDLAPMFFFAVGGALAELLKGILPTILQLVNQILIDDPSLGFPNGLPIKLGVLGQPTTLEFGQNFQDSGALYQVDYVVKLV